MSLPEKNERIRWLDAARCLAILLVVMQHCTEEIHTFESAVVNAYPPPCSVCTPACPLTLRA